MLDETGTDSPTPPATNSSAAPTRGVLALSGWAFDNLLGLFGRDGADSTQQFALELEKLRPAWIVHEGRLADLGLDARRGVPGPNVTDVYLDTQYDSFFYSSWMRKELPPG